MNESEITNRFYTAVEFLKESGYAKNYAEMARKIGVNKSAFSMAINGRRPPQWDMLLDFCEAYPINFWWIRNGTGEMVRVGSRELELLAKIARLEARIAELETKTPDR